MILSKHNVLFLKNPKTGGTSLLKALQKVYGFKYNDYNGLISSFKNDYYGEKEFIQPEQYANLQYYKNVDFCAAYTVIRDPVDRFMSVCRHFRDYGAAFIFSEELDSVCDEHDRLLLSKEIRLNPIVFSNFSKKLQEKYRSISLQEIGERIIETPIEAPNGDNDPLPLNFIRIPQIFYFNDPRVTALDYANLQEELHKVFKKHNIHVSNLPKVNVGTRFTEDEFSPEFVNKIKQVYREDVEFYDKLSTR